MRLSSFLIVAVWLLLGAGPAQSHPKTATGDEELDTLAREFLKTFNEFTATLATIKDKETAENAKARLLAVFKRLQEVEKKVNALGPAQQKRLEEKHGKDLASMLPTVLKESARLKRVSGVLEVFEDTPLYWDFFSQPRMKPGRKTCG